MLVTDGHLPYPYGLELTGYEVAKLSDTLDKAKTAGAVVLAGPYSAGWTRRRNREVSRAVMWRRSTPCHRAARSSIYQKGGALSKAPP